MTGFQFQDPMWLLLLIPLALAAFWMVYRRRRVAVLFSDVTIPRALPVTMALRVKRLLPWMSFLAVALLIVGLARPQQGRTETRVITEGNLGTTFLLSLVGAGISILGWMACCIGIIFAIPLVQMLWVVGYLMMSGQIPLQPDAVKRLV